MGATKSLIDRRSFLALGGGAVATCGVPRLATAGAPARIGSAPAVRAMTGGAFATAWRIVVPAGATPERLSAAIDKLLGGIDLQMSPWRTDSTVTAFNRGKAGSRTVPRELVRVTAAALAIAEASGGVFDPSVGPLVARWGFGVISGEDRPGWQGLSVQGDAVSKDRDGLTLDFCGIAKGRALDRMAMLLADAGLDDFLVDLGGELLAFGRHPSGRAWQVGVEDPRPGATGMAEVVRLDGNAVATSGDRANGYAFGGRRYSHIIDPRTRQPVAGDLASVSVIAEDAMTADGWATALAAAGANGGPILARRRGIAALFLVRDGAGLRRIATGAFDQHLA
jgi:thiamine biosynthesis lipoprotein